MIAKRGLELTYETVRNCCLKFDPFYAKKLKAQNHVNGAVFGILKRGGKVVSDTKASSLIPIIADKIAPDQ